MSDVLVFTPKHELDFQKNYDDFIAFAKNELTLFKDLEFKSRDGIQRGWDCDKWSWKTSRGKKLTIVFGISHSHSRYTAYQPAFADFAKAYVRYHQSLNHNDSVMWASSLTWLYKALAEQAELNNQSTFDIMDINNSVINRTEELIVNSNLSPGGKRNIGLSLEKILAFIKKMHFKLNIQDWKNPFARPKDSTIKLDKKSREKELDKCPSDYQMLKVADAFHLAKTPRQMYFTSLCVMLMCQPARSVELNGLTIDSLQKSEKGRWYLMWYPAKGGDPVRKWIPKQIEDVVKQAFDKLIDISAPARAAAKYAFDYPDHFMIHDDCITSENFSQDKELTFEQFAQAMGIQAETSGRLVGWRRLSINLKWLNKLISNLNDVNDWKTLLPPKSIINNQNEVLRILSIGNKPEYELTGVTIKFPSYRDLKNIIHTKYQTHEFPFYAGIPLWKSLCLVRDREFHKSFNSVRPFSWIPVGHGMIADALGSGRETTQRSGNITSAMSIFEELNITDEDGKYLKLTSHQFRHWLNTKLKLSGEEDWLIAKWSGRADVKQNKAYDGRTQEQKSRLTNKIGHVGKNQGLITIAEVNKALTAYTSKIPPPPMILHDLALPISLKSLGVSRDGVAQFTGLGYCVHNYAENPCIKNGDCMTCSDHVCIKGLPNTLDELKNLEKLYEEQLARAKDSAKDNVFGADRWVTSLGFRLSKVKTIILILEDPKTPDGKQIRIPNNLDISPVKRSMNIDETTVIPTLDFTKLALMDLDE